MDQQRKSRDKEADTARKTKLRPSQVRQAPTPPSAAWDGRFFLAGWQPVEMSWKWEVNRIEEVETVKDWEFDHQKMSSA